MKAFTRPNDTTGFAKSSPDSVAMKLMSLTTLVIILASATGFVPETTQPLKRFIPSWGRMSSSESFATTSDAVESKISNCVPESLYLPLSQGSRRTLLSKVAGTLLSASAVIPILSVNAQTVNAEVGTLPELSDTNVVLQGLTVNVADKSQQDGMISFLIDSFDFKVLRKRQSGDVTETVSSSFLILLQITITETAVKPKLFTFFS